MDRYDVEIIIGSTSDEKAIKNSGMLTILEMLGISYRLSAISAHRNPDILTEHCVEAKKTGTKVFIGAAALSAALPGAIASAISRERPVLGAALSAGALGPLDAIYSMISMPPGVPVNFCGVDKPGLVNAALAACQIIALTDPTVATKLRQWLVNKTKSAEIGIATFPSS